MAVSEETINHFLGHIGRHLVCIALRIVDFDENGKAKPQERFAPCSAFVISLRSRWFLVTAGHVLSDIEQGLRTKRIAINHCCIVDYFGKDATVRMPTPFDIESANKGYLDNPGIGLDLGLIELSPLYRAGLEKNGILALEENHWIHQSEIEFDCYYLCGFPQSLADEVTSPVALGSQMTAGVRTMALPIRHITDLGEVPDTVVIPDAELDWFIGEILSTPIPDISGMSGGPIIGVKFAPDGAFIYWIVALQSIRYGKTRIIRACPAPIFAELVWRLMEEHSVGDD